ncbi:Ig-like domain-containing protein [Puia sp. P3]|uniref:Ig-like domain-containing protein n=1 Tax=Puia sp. P3 TaxID=3423952 RepID=UPI003D67D389
MTLKKALGLLLISLSIVVGRLQAQSASFNFSSGPQPVSGWTNVYGNPAGAVCTGSSNGITLTSVATANWVPYSNGLSAVDGGGQANGTFFPAAVMANFWFQCNGSLAGYNALVPQLKLSGLSKDSLYTIKMTTSYSQNIGTIFELNPMHYTVTGAVVYNYIEVNGDYNTANGAVFTSIAPDANGVVQVYVNTYGASNVAGISGIQVTAQHAATGTPVVTITQPTNNSAIAEGASVTINATATETGGTISKVEFFIDTTKIGEDATSPYSQAWTANNPGAFQIKAKATDAGGVTTTATINVTVQSGNYFWSTTGQIATGADSNFVGTVDTNDLAFRTNNIERMRILKDGTINVPGTGSDPADHPAFRLYGNGDLTMSTTMDKSFDTDGEQGLRYYSKHGYMQIGASDRVDTTQPVDIYPGVPSSGLIVNSDAKNTIKGRMANTVFVGDINTMDSLTWFENCLIATEGSHFAASMVEMDKTIMYGFGNQISGSISSSLVGGSGNYVTKPMDISLINGFQNVTMDTTRGAIIGGANNQYGGLSQLAAGQFLVNRTPYGTALGNGNVDFAALPYTGIRGTTVPNIGSYPLLAVGNSKDNNGATRSNAFTILYNGRTQINTTGFANALNQSAVTPKAALDVVSTNTGVLLPRLTTAQRNAIVSGDLQNGLLLYNTDSSAFQYYNGAAWNSVGSGAAGSSSGHWTYNNGLQYDSVNSVAIGTNSVPTGYMLAVKGSGIFTHLQVKSVANWPDYVFEKKYQLRTLEDLETYIGRYKHLPDVASVAKVNAEGIDLGANQATILKNVEELTLHLIEENKQLKAQGAKATELEKKVADQDARFVELQRQIDALKALINKTNN